MEEEEGHLNPDPVCREEHGIPSTEKKRKEGETNPPV